MKVFPIFFISYFSLVNAAFFTSYYDDNCSLPIASSLAFTDVCTWSSNKYSGSFSFFLDSCNETMLNTIVFNASDAPTCQGIPNYEISITGDCNKFDTIFIKASDFTCISQNTTYNILSHFQSDCKDGGVPFSVQLGKPSCQGDSFAPGFLNWDTEGFYNAPYYSMEVYNSTNGSCTNRRALFQTENFPAQCLAPEKPFDNIYLDIYNAFPVNLNFTFA